MHPAQHHVTATRKRQKEWVEGRARGGSVNRPGRLRGGASEEPSDTQSTSTPPEDHYGPGQPAASMRASGGKLDAADRRALPRSDFALPGRGSGPQGKGSGSYPIPDESHARNALARVSQHGSSEEKAQVRAKVHAKYPSIGKA